MPKILQLIGPPVILCLAIPLALIASVTTTLALVALVFRASIVYFELGFALLESWVFPKVGKKSSGKRRRCSEAAAPNTPKQRRHSRSSASNAAGGRVPRRNESLSALMGAGANRDFEGLGGWRVAVDARDDETWMGINSRLELPTAGAATAPTYRRHRRTQSSQSHVLNLATDSARTNPFQSRVRTPQSVGYGHEPPEYFDASHGKDAAVDGAAVEVIPMSPEESAAKVRMDERRKSVGAGSSASSASSVRSITGITLSPSQ